MNPAKRPRLSPESNMRSTEESLSDTISGTSKGQIDPSEKRKRPRLKSRMDQFLMHIKDILNEISPERSGYNRFEDSGVEFPPLGPRIDDPRMTYLLAFSPDKLPKTDPDYRIDRGLPLHHRERELCEGLRMTYAVYYTQKCRFFVGLGIAVAAERQLPSWKVNIGKAQAQLLGNIDATLMSCLWSHWEIWGWVACNRTGLNLAPLSTELVDARANTAACRAVERVLAAHEAGRPERWADFTQAYLAQSERSFQEMKAEFEAQECVDSSELARVREEDAHKDVVWEHLRVEVVLRDLGIPTGRAASYSTKSTFDGHFNDQYANHCLEIAETYEKAHPEVTQWLRVDLRPEMSTDETVVDDQKSASSLKAIGWHRPPPRALIKTQGPPKIE